ncbi:hypothetical protein SCB71_04865 [Herbiconiux sp. KACC 21604]|uniref:hypothetical protein n=1 Tax=unclassified Herbiconiux TaxID=2618217 RepID=UPI00149179AD|nr:hypothetical protein [Herbiconiux sp. SALV-R1]QJU52681.1 hypothetical protein HL652_02845 [Herbiconiux sp. SALV-R1]WPO87579.1 hypothetical protein SCB71_04865 [Herbiconiux sp. KACC 21604]
MSGFSEQELVAEARAALSAAGDSGGEVLAAGVFGLADLVVAEAVGLAAGSMAGGGDGGSGAGALGAGVAAALGGLAATKAAAEAQGVTVQLLVAITPDTIHVLNRDTGGRLRTEVASFPRATTRATIEKIGLSRHLTLADSVTGASIRLHGSTSWISAQSQGDKLVLELLAD